MRTKTPLILPLQGKIFVWEGHDSYAHHLRVPLGEAKVQALGITANSNNFASDFIYLDGQGREYRDDPRKLDNWYSYGRPIYAPGAGIVLAAANDIPENWFEDAGATKNRASKTSGWQGRERHRELRLDSNWGNSWVASASLEIRSFPIGIIH